MSALAIRGISKRYGPVTALEDIDLDIPALRRTAIVGASGSGKTTLLRIIAGFETPDAGSITMDGTVLVDGSTFVPAHRRGIGFVSQDGSLFPHLSIADNIGFGLRGSAAERRRRVAELIDLVQLEPATAQRRPSELSGGQQQRVALARALAPRPRVILLDEPFSSLDAGLRDSMRKVVGDILTTAGVTAILVTHDQAEALSFSDHLAVLRDGRLVQAGPPKELYLAPRDPALAQFLGDAIILPAVVGDGWVECRLGRLPAPAGRAPGAGTILIRPEKLRLEPVGGDAGDVPAERIAIIRDASFAGATTTLRLDWANGPADTPFICRMSGGDPMQSGDKVLISVSGAVHIFE